jgi:NAD dependent epimerase/dehydratase family enzyme
MMYHAHQVFQWIIVILIVCIVDCDAFESAISSDSSVKRIGITGCNGLIGKALVNHFQQQGANIVRLSTRISPNQAWSASDPNNLEDLDAIIHLAGESILPDAPFQGGWSAMRKKEIKTSRIDGTKQLVDSLLKLKAKPRILLSASAVGYYGYYSDHVAKPFDESTKITAHGKFSFFHFLSGLLPQLI